MSTSAFKILPDGAQPAGTSNAASTSFGLPFAEKETSGDFREERLGRPREACTVCSPLLRLVSPRAHRPPRGLCSSSAECCLPQAEGKPAAEKRSERVVRTERAEVSPVAAQDSSESAPPSVSGAAAAAGEPAANESLEFIAGKVDETSTEPAAGIGAVSGRAADETAGEKE